MFLGACAASTPRDPQVPALEARLTALEARPPAPAPAAAPSSAALEARVAALEARIVELGAKLDAVAAVPQARPPAARPGQLDPTKAYAVPIDDSPMLGSLNAAVTIVAALQFPEPYTHRVWPTLVKLLQTYPQELRIMVKLRIVHPIALRSSVAACAVAAQDALGPFEDAVWGAAHDGADGAVRPVEDAELRDLARGMRLDLKEYDRDLGTCAAGQVRDDALFARLAQHGVPAFFINGRLLSGAQPIEAFRKLIDEELAKAKADRARGGKAADYYDRLLRTAEPVPAKPSP